MNAKNDDAFQKQNIMPHANLLKIPDKNCQLYKIIPSKYFFDMVEKNYLYFRRVDTYNDDKKDSSQPDNNKETYGNMAFEKNPDFKLADLYARSRSRTYACCFSTENSKYIWKNYSSGDVNAVCLVFNCGNLIKYLKSVFEASHILYGEKVCNNFFYIDFGLVEYGIYDQYLSKRDMASNPIEFVYFKDQEKYSEEKEFRISLAAEGMPEKFILPDKTVFTFPESIYFMFNFKDLLLSNALKEIRIEPDSTEDFKIEFEERAKKAGIGTIFEK